MTTNPLLGVWRLLSLTRGHEVATSQTHLVVRDDVLWEVHPKATYYEAEPGPEKSYRLTWKGRDGFLEVLRPPRPSFFAIVRVRGERLRVRWGGVLGQYPKSFDDEAGLLAVFERETKDAETIAAPPPRAKRTRRRHAALGELAYDDDLAWWTGEIDWGGRENVHLYVMAAKDCDDAPLDRVAAALERVRRDDLEAFAAEKLLDVKNDAWLGDDETPLDAAAFRARLSPATISADGLGRITFDFDDGGLFAGHGVSVRLDESLRPTRAEMG